MGRRWSRRDKAAGGSPAASVRSEYAALPSGALSSQRSDPKSPGQTYVANSRPPAQTPGTVFIINIEPGRCVRVSAVPHMCHEPRSTRGNPGTPRTTGTAGQTPQPACSPTSQAGRFSIGRCELPPANSVVYGIGTCSDSEHEQIRGGHRVGLGRLRDHGTTDP